MKHAQADDLPIPLFVIASSAFATRSLIASDVLVG